MYLTYTGSNGGSPSKSLCVRGSPLLSLQKGMSNEEKAMAWNSSCLTTSKRKSLVIPSRLSGQKLMNPATGRSSELSNWHDPAREVTLEVASPKHLF